MRRCQNCGCKAPASTNGNRKCHRCRDVHLPDLRQIAARCKIERQAWSDERLGDRAGAVEIKCVRMFCSIPIGGDL